MVHGGCGRGLRSRASGSRRAASDLWMSSGRLLEVVLAERSLGRGPVADHALERRPEVSSPAYSVARRMAFPDIAGGGGSDSGAVPLKRPTRARRRERFAARRGGRRFQIRYCGIFSNSPPLRADWWATMPGTVRLSAMTTSTRGFRFWMIAEMNSLVR